MKIYDDLISILFRLPDGRSLEEYFKNILLVGKATEDDLQADVTIPEVGKKYASYEEVIADFKATSQFALEADKIFQQKNNTQTKSQIKYLFIVVQKDSEDIKSALNRAKTNDGKFVKVVPISRVGSDIVACGEWCLTNNRFMDCVVATVDDVETLVNSKNNYCYAIFRKQANECIASAVASTSTCGYFGGTDGSAQFTQLVGILPETYTGEEISDMKSNNIAFYTNVSPIDGGETDTFGYNWVIGSKMLGGELRQRQMIKHYVEKGLGLTILEFFNKKPNYDETGNNLLLFLLNKFMRSCQEYKLIIPTTDDQIGFELNVIPIRTGADSIMNTDVEAYNGKKYKVKGYYYDAIVGEKVDIELFVDPNTYEIEQILGKVA